MIEDVPPPYILAKPVEKPVETSIKIADPLLKHEIIKNIIKRSNDKKICNRQLVFHNSHIKLTDKQNMEFGKQNIKSIMKSKKKYSFTTPTRVNEGKNINIQGQNKIGQEGLNNIADLTKLSVMPWDVEYLGETAITGECDVKFYTDINDNDKKYKNDSNKFCPISKTKDLRIVLINFEDDTTRPIIEIENNKMKILENWYKVCNISAEFEITNQIIPKEIVDEKLRDILYYDLNYSIKSEFVDSYLPLVFNQIISSEKIKNYEKKFSQKNAFFDTPKQNVVGNNYLQDMRLSSEYLTDTAPIKIADALPKEFIDTPKHPVYATVQPTMNLYDGKKICSEKNNSLFGVIIPENIFPSEKYLNGAKNVKDRFLVKKYIFETRETILNNVEINPYNFEYDVLNPPFGRNAYKINSLIVSYDLSEISGVSQSTLPLVNPSDRKDVITYSIMYNLKYKTSFIIKHPSIEEMELIEDCNKYGFINLTNIRTNNNEISESINSNFDLCEFNSVNEINLKLNAFSEIVQYISKHVNMNNSHANEENKIRIFINNNFTIDNNVENRMKSSALYDKIIDSGILKHDTISSFKIRLAKYLQNMGLEKKRYSDGIYYYGIKSKY